MTHIEIDLETLGTGHNSSIVSIGAVVFDPEEGKLGDEFYVTISRQSCKSRGFIEDESTLKWWKLQSAAARNEWENATTDIKDALQQFDDWLKSVAPWRSRIVWANSPSFDCALINDAYKLCGRTNTPWPFYNERDHRTLKELRPEITVAEDERTGTYHNALDDAKTQAKQAIEIMNDIGE